MIRKQRGTIDVMPEETPVYRYIEETARKTAAKYGFEEIRIPTFEATELYRRGVGTTTDVVQKEMYTFSDLDNRSITLRPEGTAGVARAMIEHGRCSDAMPQKLYYILSCFRYEAPQAGRSREFFQFGTELFGAPTAYADASVIALADELLHTLGIKDLTLNINSIGCPSCRPKYREALVSYFEQYESELCESCRGRLHTNPMRILDCKSPVCGKIAAGAPRTLDYLCPECAEHFETLKASLDSLGIKYTVNTSIVRGLDYYTKSVFEFVAGGLGAQSTVCAGGRYDGLVSELDGPSLPAVGFGMGITRVILAMTEAGVKIPGKEPPLIYIAPLGKAAAGYALTLTQKLRADGIYAECDIVGRSLKAQMKYADKTGAVYTLIIGDSELESGKGQLRMMADSSQSEIAFSELPAFLSEKNRQKNAL